MIPIGLGAQAVRRAPADLGDGQAGRSARRPTRRWTRRRWRSGSQRRLKPSRPNNFGIVTSDTFLGMFRQITAGIFGVLIGVVALSLVVGGIVIMNIMLMVVSERTAEIGLRKALGAQAPDIIWQFLIESIVLSTLGGVVGTTLGFGGGVAGHEVHADAGVGARLLGRHGHRDDGGRRALLRPLPVDQGREARPDRSVETGIGSDGHKLHSSPTRWGWRSGRSAPTRCARG